MRCERPFIVGGQAFGCGQCLACRLNRRRMWTLRLMWEMQDHAASSFVTLTYAEEPRGSNDLPTLVPAHTRDFLKRFRASIAPVKIRYYLVGEYGDETWRPHYHLALFGWPGCECGPNARARGWTRYDRRGNIACCDNCRRVHNAWGHGRVDCAELTEQSAQYVCGYTVKKMTAFDDPRLAGRHPEFARMSNRPGIGSGRMLDEYASTLMQFDLVDTRADVPSAARVGSRLLPLGRYLRGKLRERVGKDAKAPLSTIREAEERLFPLRVAAREDEVDPSFRSHIVRASKGSVASLHARFKISQSKSKRSKKL